MGDKLDLTGRTFGRLAVSAESGVDKNGSVLWQCKCVCGGSRVVPAGDLTSGRTVSCGCRRDETLKNTEKYREKMYVDGTKLDALRPKKLRHNNVSGINGVTPYKKTDRWLAQIVLRGKRTHLGIFDTMEEAANARKRAEEELFEPVLEEHGYKTAEDD